MDTRREAAHVVSRAHAIASVLEAHARKIEACNGANVANAAIRAARSARQGDMLPSARTLALAANVMIKTNLFCQCHLCHHGLRLLVGGGPVGNGAEVSYAQSARTMLSPHTTQQRMAVFAHWQIVRDGRRPATRGRGAGQWLRKEAWCNSQKNRSPDIEQQNRRLGWRSAPQFIGNQQQQPKTEAAVCRSR